MVRKFSGNFKAVWGVSKRFGVCNSVRFCRICTPLRLCCDVVVNYPWCGDCAFSASFVKECTDVSYVAGQGVGLKVHKEKCCCRGNKRSRTEISSCAIYL